MPSPTMFQVHLQEGFEAEPVRISIDDAVVLDEPQVRTKPQIGLAQIIEADTTATSIAVHVEFGGRHTEQTVQVEPASTPYVGVSVGANGDVLIRTQAEPFGYL